MNHREPRKWEPLLVLITLVLMLSYFVFPARSALHGKPGGRPRPPSRVLERYLDDDGVATGSLRKGDTAPDFRVEYLEGGTTRLSELAKAHPVIVLNFFATWCGPCREELPELSRLGFDFRKEGLLVLAVSSERAQKISDFAGDQYPGVLLAKDPGGTGRFAFGVSGIPATFVLTRDRKVQAAYSGYSSTRMKELRDRVIALLRASPEAPASDSAPAGAGTRA